MKARFPSLDGRAAQNTRNVLVALDAYEQKLLTGSTRGEAEQVAATVYQSLIGKRVVGRTVRSWLAVVRSYGGPAKVPAGAFGALKSCRHAVRPTRALLRRIKKTVARLARETAAPVQADFRAVTEMALASNLLGDCLAKALNNPAKRHIYVVNALASRMEHISVHNLLLYVPELEMEAALRDILMRLEAIAAPTVKVDA